MWSRNIGATLAVSPPIKTGSLLERRGQPDWLINATPVDDSSLIGPDVPARRGVLDAVYGPRPTALIAAARQAGLQAVDGMSLLVAQAELQFELQTGRKPPTGLFAEVGQRYLDDLG
jgi:shikimate 5-dehydrogenase